ncbi:MAG: cation:proton antiporter [Mariprofundales bacterium]
MIEAMVLADSIIVLAALLALAVLASGLGQRFRFPFSVLLVLFGMIIGAMADHIPAFYVLHNFQLTPDLVLFLFLPALIFESGFNLDARALLNNLAPVLMMAIPALLLSSFLIAAGLWWICSIPFVVALLFGILISATDPVAVIDLFRELGAPLRLTVLVEGESLFNDATALVGFHVLLAVLIGNVVAADSYINNIFQLTNDLLFTLGGGICIGVFAGWLFGELMRLVGKQEAILALSLILAYSVFVIAEHKLHVSGVVATLSAALTLAAWGKMRMPRMMGQALIHVWEFLAYICNAFLFLLIGLSVSFSMLWQYLGEAIVAILLVLVARAIGVHTFIPVTVRMFHLPQISVSERHIMWWGGLKGGLAIAMALAIPNDFAQRDMILSMTAAVVLFSLFVNAATIRALMQFLQLDKLTAAEKAEQRYGQGLAIQAAKRVLKRFQRANMLSMPMKKKVRREIIKVFGKQAKRPSSKNELQHVYIALLRIEHERLEDLFDTGVAPQYVLLDLGRVLRHERDFIQDQQILPQWEMPKAPREMRWLLSTLREYDVLVGLLARYQNLRLAHQIVLRMVRLITTEAAIENLQQMQDIRDETKAHLLAHFGNRVEKLRHDLEGYRHDFPIYYKQFSYNISKRAVLSAALFQLRDAWIHGQVGGKVFHRITRQIYAAIDIIPTVGTSLPAYSMTDLLENIPLFAGLSVEIVQKIAGRVELVRVLTGDRIITQGQKGHALYIIEHGLVEIIRNQKNADGHDTTLLLAVLEEGAFFGEIALLGENIRTSNVVAMCPTRLLRISRQQILQLSQEYPEITKHLTEAAQRRQHHNFLMETQDMEINK